MKFSDTFIAQVAEAHNIVDHISSYAKLKPSGVGRYMGICPFPSHNEKTASFSVSESKQVYHCFGCKKSGNIYHFIEETQGLHFVDAVKFLAEKAGIALPAAQVNPKEEQLRNKKSNLFSINEEALKYFQTQLQEEIKKKNSPLKSYLSQRGLTEQIIKDFQLGFAPDKWQGFCDVLEAKKMDMKLAENLGLIKIGKKGHYDMYRNRLIFPIFSHQQKLVGFGARSLTSEQQPKYINSSDSLIFSKSHTLYGLPLSLPYIREENQVIIVEGYMDFLALYQAGIRNVVANLGTALTLEHAKLLKRHTPYVLVFFDGDEAGQKALERSATMLFEQEFFVKGLVLEDGLDPDDFLKKFGTDNLKEKLKKAPELFYLLMKKAFKDYQGQAIEKVQVLETLKPYLNVMDKRLTPIYYKSLSERLSVDLSYVKTLIEPESKRSSALSKTRVFKATASTENQKTPSSSKPKEVSLPAQFNLSKSSQLELYLINLALSDPLYLKTLREKGGFEESKDKNLKSLWEKICELSDSLLETESSFFHITSSLMGKVQPRESLQILEQKAHWDSLEDEQKEKFFEDCFKKVKKMWLQMQIQDLRSQITDPEKQEAMLEQIMKINKQKRRLDSSDETDRF